jgi:hypothetical protein
MRHVTNIELIINLKTRMGNPWVNLKPVKAPGLEVPPMRLARTGEVI